MWYKKEIHLEQVLGFLIKAFLFLLPWQTIWIYREININGYKLQWGTLGFYATEILLWLIVLVFLGWFAQRIKEKGLRKKFQISRDRIFVFSILLFVIYCLLSSVWALDSQLAWQHGLRIMEMFLLFFILFLGPVDFWHSAKWFVFGAVPVALLGIGQFLWQSAFTCKWLGLVSHQSWVGGTSVVAADSIGRWLRAYGSFSHPNIFGGYMFVALSVLSALCVVGFCSNKKYRVFQYLLSTIFILALVLSFSRTAFLSAIFMVIMMCLYSFFKRKGLFAGIYFKYSLFLFVLLVLLFLPLFSIRYGHSNSVFESRSMIERVDLATESLEIFKANKWLGVGAGNYTLASFNFNNNLEGWQYQPVHSAPLLILVELGIVGFILFLLVVISFFNFLYLFWRKRGKTWMMRNMSFVFNVILLLFPLFIIACLDHYFYTSYVGVTMMGVYWALWAKYSTQ